MRGSCYCGAIRYEIQEQPRSVVGCHCSQCRKLSGHFVASTQVDDEYLSIDGSDNITWFQSSETATRGFCKTCGSPLFWKPKNAAVTSIMAGTLDGKTGLVLDRQIYSESKGDYYDLPDVPTVDQSTL